MYRGAYLILGGGGVFNISMKGLHLAEEGETSLRNLHQPVKHMPQPEPNMATARTSGSRCPKP